MGLQKLSFSEVCVEINIKRDDRKSSNNCLVFTIIFQIPDGILSDNMTLSTPVSYTIRSLLLSGITAIHTWSALISLGRLRKRSILASSCHGWRMNFSPWTTWIWLSGKYSSHRLMCTAYMLCNCTLHQRIFISQSLRESRAGGMREETRGCQTQFHTRKK